MIRAKTVRKTAMNVMYLTDLLQQTVAYLPVHC